ncbi:hypothetical protein HQ447_04595 [bacterium]|nr:hypothetical protein [bacterium]
MHEANQIDGVTFDLITDIIREWPAVLAGKAVRADMITALPTDNRPDGIFDPFVEVAAESV